MRELKFASLILIVSLNSPFALAVSTSKEAAEKYEQALIAKQNNEIKTAIIHLKNALQLNNNYIAAHILLGKLYLDENRGALAEKELTKANTLGADRSLTVIPLAESYHLQFKFKDVIEKIFPLGYSPTISSKLYILQGQAYSEIKSFKNAKAAFNEAQKLNPDSIDSLLGLASIYLQQGKPAKANEYIDKAKNIDNSNPDVWYIQGSTFHAASALKEAEVSYSKVIKAKPDHTSALIARAGVYIDQNKLKQAYGDISTLRKLNPMDPRAAYFQAVLLAKTGDKKSSKKALLKASSIIDSMSREAILEHAPSLLLAGLIKFSLGEYEKANDYLKNYVLLYPHNPSARKLLGSTLIKNKEYQNAASVLEPALKITPDDYKLLTMLGTAYMHTNQHTQAAEMFDKALILGNQDSSIRFESALNQLASGNKNTAIDELDSIFSTDNNNDKAGILLAMLFIKNLELQKALKITKQLAEKKPNNLTVLNLHASTLLSTGDLINAKKILDQILIIDPNLISAQINRVKIDIQENQINKANQRLLDLLKKNPNSDLIMQQLAIISTQKGDKKSAQLWLEKAHAKNPRSINTSTRLMDYYLSDNNPQKAIGVGEDIQSKHPNNLQIMDALGRSYLAANKIRTAQAILKRMSLIANYNSRALHRIAKLQLQTKDTDNAIWSLRKAITSDKKDLASIVLLTDVLIQSNKLSLAQKEAKNIIKLFPKHAQGYGLQGDIALAERKIDVAIKNYKKSLNIKPTPRAISQLSLAYQLANKNKEAENNLRKWLIKHPEDSIIRQRLAEFYLLTGSKLKATKHYNILLNTGNENAQILNNLAMIHADSDSALALQYAQKAIKLAPEQAIVIDTLGWLLVKNERYQEGLTYLRDANARQSTNPEIHYHIAIALNKLGRTNEAIRELKIAIEANQYFEGLSIAEDLLRKWEK